MTFHRPSHFLSLFFLSLLGLIPLPVAAQTKPTTTLTGHTDHIYRVAFSPDGKRIVSGSEDKTVRVWDTGTGKEILTLEGHTKGVCTVAFSSDGKRILSGSRDNRIKVWDAENGKAILTIKGQPDEINCVAFSPDGKRFAIGGDDKTVRVWDTEKGTEILNFKGHSHRVESVAFSSDGKRIVSSSGDLGKQDIFKPSEVKVWDAEKGKEILTLTERRGVVCNVAFSPDGKHILSRSATFFSLAEAALWNVDKGEEILRLKKDEVNNIWCVALSPDGKRIVTGCDGNSVIVWDAGTGKEILTLKGHTEPVPAVAFSPDGKRIVSGSWDKTIKIWDISPEK